MRCYVCHAPAVLRCLSCLEELCENCWSRHHYPIPLKARECEQECAP